MNELTSRINELDERFDWTNPIYILYIYMYS
jgi:hypothetical protein